MSVYSVEGRPSHKTRSTEGKYLLLCFGVNYIILIHGLVRLQLHHLHHLLGLCLYLFSSSSSSSFSCSSKGCLKKHWEKMSPMFEVFIQIGKKWCVLKSIFYFKTLQTKFPFAWNPKNNDHFKKIVQSLQG